MSDLKLTWFKIAEDEKELEFAGNNIAVVEVRGKKICITRFGEQLFAFPYGCPHAAGILADGWITVKGEIVCPLHKYRFSLQNGRNTTGEGYFLKRWPVENREDGVFVGFETSGLFGWM